MRNQDHRGLWADPAERVAFVLRARGESLLRAHRHRLRREDLEECLSQAALELVVQVRSGVAFASTKHVANVLEQRFLSRVHDRRRAIEGRSPAQAGFERALGAGLFESAEQRVPDPRADVEPMLMMRFELQQVNVALKQLTADQRLVLGGQLEQVACADFCERFGWSSEKYRKVAQRARNRLRSLVCTPASAGLSPESDRAVATAQGVSVPVGGTRADRQAGTNL